MQQILERLKDEQTGMVDDVLDIVDHSDQNANALIIEALRENSDEIRETLKEHLVDNQKLLLSLLIAVKGKTHEAKVAAMDDLLNTVYACCESYIQDCIDQFNVDAISSKEDAHSWHGVNPQNFH